MLLLEAVVTPNTAPITTGLARITTDVLKTLTSVNWAAPSWDLFIVLFFVVTVFLYGISLGRDRIIVILIAIYMSIAVVANAPFLGNMHADINIGQDYAFRIASFLGLFLLLFFLLSRSALTAIFANLAAGKWWQVLVFSAFHVGLLVSVTLSYLPKEAIASLAPLTQTLFATSSGRFFWVIAPIVGMVLLKA